MHVTGRGERFRDRDSSGRQGQQCCAAVERGGDRKETLHSRTDASSAAPDY